MPTLAAELKSILIVDDSAVQRAFAVDLCRKLGIETIHEAGDGSIALERLASLAVLPDVIMIDLEMPGMDGIELMQQLHQRDILVPLVVASGRDEALLQSAAHMIEALGLPLLGVAKKPLSLAVVAEVLGRYEA